MSELTPITRVESYLDAIVNSGTPPLEDITRIETFLQAIYDNQVCALTPITRIEMFLGKISGQDIVLPEPITRIELYLAAIAGEDVELPENPITRLEMYLAEWADSGDWTTISGAIVEFIAQRAHKLKSCVVSLSPQQDLHGYDSPWPAGGGKNKFDEDTVYSEYKQSDGSFLGRAGYINLISTPIPASCVGQQLTFSAMLKIPSGSIVTNIRVNAKVNGTSISGNAVNSSDYTKSSVTFTPTSASDTVNITFGSESGQNLQFKDIQLEIGSTATSFAPYSNICPISGWTGLEGQRTGRNLLDLSLFAEAYPDSCSYSNDTLSVSNPIGAMFSTGIDCFIPAYSTINATITAGTGTNIRLKVVYADGTAQDLPQNYLPKIIEKDVVSIRLNWSNAGSFTISNAQAELGRVATEYEPFTGEPISVSFPSTVYGGSDEVVGGELISDRGKMVATNDGNWRFDVAGGSYNYVYYRGVTIPNELTKLLCNIAPTVNNSTDLGITRSGGGFIQIYVHALGITSLAEWNTYITNNTVEIVYPLATPITIQLTPQQVTALKGYNAMWSNAGDIEVTVHGTPVEVETLQALNMLLGGAYRNDGTEEDVSDEEALDIILGGEQR